MIIFVSGPLLIPRNCLDKMAEPREPAGTKLADESPQQESSCRCCIQLRVWNLHDPLEVVTLVSMVFLALGTVFTVLGYVIPREYEFDPNKDAREMEAIEAKYSKIGQALDVLLITGMGCVVISGVTMAAVALIMICREREELIKEDQNEIYPLRGELPSQYGTASQPPQKQQ